MDLCSSRTVAITGRMPAAIASWTAKYGREPNQRELLYIRQAVTLATRNGKDQAVIDWDGLAARWDGQLGGQLASIAPRVSRLRAQARASDAHAHASHADATHATTRGATRKTAGPQAKPRRADPGRPARARSDPAGPAGLDPLRPAQAARGGHATADRFDDPDAAVALLHELADAAIDGLVEPVVCLDPPEWPPLPGYLRRDLDGRSVYTRPGTSRYATRVQLCMEEQLLRDAQRHGAPHLARDHAATLLGADAAELETHLRKHAKDYHADATGTGLRLDQSAALFHALTAERTVEVLIGPAGSGKTRTIAAGAQAWIQAGKGPVIGIATAQAARNVLAEAGVQVAENSSVFLGHMPGRRGAIGIRDIGPGTLLIIDEASIMSLPDLAEIIAHATRNSAKVIIAGDCEQLAAVESGGGLTLLARRLGYVQLTEAVRFTAQWERDASLRPRTGEVTALGGYHQHGRIRGADLEQAIDDAVRTYVAHYLAGEDVLLMINDRERCREASRRVRDSLIHLGMVSNGREIELAGGARASAGDLIITPAQAASPLAGPMISGTPP